MSFVILFIVWMTVLFLFVLFVHAMNVASRRMRDMETRMNKTHDEAMDADLSLALSRLEKALEERRRKDSNEDEDNGGE